ncbi:MAG: hypothetical protein GX844_05835 [Alcaligenaceae bacterium]|jgi:uncharacterized lipoprotein|nr:hypothetical protein [Alcaligenaceae bacterium]
MLKSLIKHTLVALITVPLLSACQSSSQTRRPVSNLNDDAGLKNRSGVVISSDSGVQIYGTVDAGYGVQRVKTTIKDSDGNRRTIRSSRSGVGSFW